MLAISLIKTCNSLCLYVDLLHNPSASICVANVSPRSEKFSLGIAVTPSYFGAIILDSWHEVLSYYALVYELLCLCTISLASLSGDCSIALLLKCDKKNAIFQDNFICY